MKKLISGITSLALVALLSPLGTIPFAFAMSVEAGADQSVTTGDEVFIYAEAADLSGGAMGVSANINWGDATISHVEGVIGADHVSIDTSHIYATSGTYTVTIEATEYDSTYAEISTESDTLTITVSDPAVMTVDAGADQSVDNGTTVSITATAHDSLPLLQWAEFTWGDGDSDFYNAILPGDMFVMGSHLYENVTETTTFEVTVCMNDSVTTACDTVNVEVVVAVEALPDLIISDISLDEMGSLSYVITNQGEEYVYNYESVQDQLTISYPDGSEGIFDTLPYLTDLTFSQPSGYSTIDAVTFSEAGIYSVTICSDSLEAVLESSEDNNCLTEEFDFAGYGDQPEDPELPEPEPDLLPDLTISDIYLDTNNVLYYEITNLGLAYVEDYGSVVDSVVITNPDSSEFSFTSNPGLSDVTFSQPLASSTVTLNSLSETGSYSVRICTDSTGVIQEESENNNCMTATLEVAGVDESGDDQQPADDGSDTPSEDTTPAPVYGGGGTSAPASGGGSASDDSADDAADSAVYGGGALETEEDVTLASDEETLEEVCGAWAFTDIDENASYYDSIYEAWCNNIIHGRSATEFAPEDAILRGEVAKVVAGVFGYAPVSGLTETSYSDLSVDNPLAPYIESLTDAGLLEGYGDGTFHSDQAIIESEVEALVGRVMGEDVDASAYVEEDGTIKRGNFMEFILQ